MFFALPLFGPPEHGVTAWSFALETRLLVKEF
jgi:hypothetical protein